MILREKFNDLADPELPGKEQVELWKAIRGMVPDALIATRKFAEPLLTAYIKSELGI